MKHTVSSNEGFSMIELMAILCIAGIIIAGIWTTTRSEPNTSNNSIDNQSSISEKTISQQDDEVNTYNEATPREELIEYSNETYGFKFSYPKAVGSLTPVPNSQLGSIISYEQSEDKDNSFAPYTRSPLIVRIDESNDYYMHSSKYGPTIKYVDNKWIVSDPEPRDKQIGEDFPAKVVATINGVPVYDFSFGDEGCEYTNWVFQNKNVFVKITLPSVCADVIDAVPLERLESYQIIVKSVLDSLQIE